ncbi:alpha/beta fold hydrolase [Mycolicibacterium psychrotolerans]|uniref:Hydrolase n=1 Tax=Mycolicibacterium psychrotolerans TaxID=216929 RepID=A0A7I7MCI6_9MYCO|nr:alpha/beta hydrolase [Mycolicibacterium psychrotolerans]BBX69974.1 hydrolase [Mycolicibacterium psychrotolerans]
MTTTDGLISRSLDVPGARLHYEVRGSGPLLLVVGSPMTAAEFAPLAHALAGDRTVVTYDPRGFGSSPVDDPDGPSTPELRADDVAAILDDLGAASADVFGSSGGAVTGLALVARFPGRVRTLIAHEPPLLELLPDAQEQRAATKDITDTFLSDGLRAAWMKFMVNAGFDVAALGSDPAGQPESQGEPMDPERELAEGARFFVHDLAQTTQYVPDFEALRASTSRIVIGLGAESGHLLTHRTSVALAERLGLHTTEFPGDHGGFMSAPGEFAHRLREILAA